MDSEVEAFALYITAERETAPLTRIAQRLTYIGVEVRRFHFVDRGKSDEIRVEVLFRCPRERAELLAGQVRRLVCVSSVQLCQSYVDCGGDVPIPKRSAYRQPS